MFDRIQVSFDKIIFSFHHLYCKKVITFVYASYRDSMKLLKIDMQQSKIEVPRDVRNSKGP